MASDGRFLPVFINLKDWSFCLEFVTDGEDTVVVLDCVLGFDVNFGCKVDGAILLKSRLQ